MPVRKMKSIDEIASESAAGTHARSSREVPEAEPAPVVVADPAASLYEEDSPGTYPERSSVVQQGWKAAIESGAPQGEWINDFRWTPESKLVKFLSDEPMSYRQHWVDRSAGKRSFVCLGRGCPLCEAGNRAAPKHVFSVVDLMEDEPRVSLLVVGNRVLQQLASLNDNPKSGPLTRLYWALSRTGQKQYTTHDIQVVKARDLSDDWSTSEEEVAGMVAGLSPADASAIVITSAEELRAIAHGRA